MGRGTIEREKEGSMTNQVLYDSIIRQVQEK